MKLRKSAPLVALLLLASLASAAIPADRLRSHIAWLSDTARDGRHSGSPGAAAAAQYIAGQLGGIGYDVQMQEFGGNRRNVVARRGTAGRYIILGAHYDGQGSGFPSASDNASGVAVLIEMARELPSEQLPVSVVVVAFDDEEQGMNGSRYYVEHSPFPLENAQAAIVIDTLGRSFMDLSSWTLFVLGTEYSSELAGVVEKRERPDFLVAGTDLIGPRSDFASFAVKHIPYLFFSNATHKDYHGEGDTPARIDYARLAEDATLISQIAKDTARLAAAPKYLDEPVYPASETGALERQFANVEKERKELPAAYRLMFRDLRERLKTDPSRDIRQIAATAFLAYATPPHSGFMLSFFLGPFYEAQDKRDIAIAVYEEAIKYSEGAARRELEAKVRRLRQ